MSGVTRHVKAAVLPLLDGRVGRLHLLQNYRRRDLGSVDVKGRTRRMTVLDASLGGGIVVAPAAGAVP